MKDKSPWNEYFLKPEERNLTPDLIERKIYEGNFSPLDFLEADELMLNMSDFKRYIYKVNFPSYK